jgi:drug/metabolite transporter (DMT)-like permease
MLALTVYIVLSTAFGLIVKDSQVRGQKLLALGAINYITAAIGAWIFLLLLAGEEPGFVGNNDRYSLQFSPLTLIVGVLAGLGYVVGYFVLLAAVKREGISITMAVIRLSIAIPVILSVFVWHEKPNTYQIIGIIFVCVSLPLLSQNRPSGEHHHRKADFIVLFLLFLVGGWCGLAPKMFVQVSPQDSHEIFLVFLFCSAAVINVVSLIVFRAAPTLKELLPGIMLGLCNILSNYFLLDALHKLPGIIVFPVASSVGVVLNTTLAVMIWRERLRRPVVVGIVISVLALVLINLK